MAPFFSAAHTYNMRCGAVVPKAVNMGFGVVLATIAGGLSFVPLGVLGMLVGAKDPPESKKAD